jgi:hypothetical protein
MKNIFQRLAIVGIVLATVSLTLFFGCKAKQHRTSTLIVVSQGQAAYYGKMEFEIGANGPANANAPGNIVAFRVDGEYNNRPGKAGRLYLISNDGSLDDIGGFDTNLSDDSLKASLLQNEKSD